MRYSTIIWRATGLILLGSGLAVMAVGGSMMLTSRPAGAFCVANASDSRVFLRAEANRATGIDQAFTSWMAPGARRCAKPHSPDQRVSVFVFADEQSIEGCDAEVMANQTLKLVSFAEFDRCAWKGAEVVTPD